MGTNRLASLPTDVANQIIQRLDLSDRAALAQTCHSLREATQAAERVELTEASRRPGRVSTDPFPTLFEHVQRGGWAQFDETHLNCFLRACAPLPRGDGRLQAAARRRVQARPHIIYGKPINWRDDCYRGERSAAGRPHGVGMAVSKDRYDYRSVYVGDWQEGVRSGWGIQFFWPTPPATWEDPSPGARAHRPLVSQEGGWYEGEWLGDKYSGRGLLNRPGQVYLEGSWREGQPIEEPIAPPDPAP